LYTVALNGSNFNATNQGSFPNQPEDGLFVTAAQIHNTPEPATLASAILGTVGILVLARLRRKA
jgi:hypothetical protein